RLGEIAGRLEAASEPIAERKIDVNLAVQRAIEWSHLRGAQPAMRIDGAGEQDELRLLVGAARSFENSGPHVLRSGQYTGDEALYGVLTLSSRLLAASRQLDSLAVRITASRAGG